MHAYLFIIDFFFCVKCVNVAGICKGPKLSKILWNDAMKSIKESLFIMPPHLSECMLPS